ncbi:MAG: dethiobiotin synthase [Planctomycetaceae bacterium]|nr:dethiobiotin synthase [Planctomycetaceae bacterium]
MYNGCFITGTDTDIGKTVITAALFRAGLLQGLKVAAVKPVQTGVPAFNTLTAAEDAAVYKSAIADQVPPLTDVRIEVFYRFSIPCSPHLSARLEGKEIRVEEILNEIEKLQQDGYFALLEPAGGLYVPLNDNDANLDLIQQTLLPVLLVFANRIGCINHVLLSLSELCRRNIPVIGLISNCITEQSASGDFDVIRKDNIAVIEKFSGVPVLAEVPFFEKKDIAAWNTAAKILAPVWERMNDH